MNAITARLDGTRFVADMTPRRRQLLADAREAGYRITTREDGYTEIIRLHRGTNKPLRGLILYPDGTGFDATVDLSAAKGMRSYAEFRAVLGLTVFVDPRA